MAEKCGEKKPNPNLTSVAKFSGIIPIAESKLFSKKMVSPLILILPRFAFMETKMVVDFVLNFNIYCFKLLRNFPQF